MDSRMDSWTQDSGIFQLKTFVFGDQVFEIRLVISKQKWKPFLEIKALIDLFFSTYFQLETQAKCLFLSVDRLNKSDNVVPSSIHNWLNRSKTGISNQRGGKQKFSKIHGTLTKVFKNNVRENSFLLPLVPRYQKLCPFSLSNFWLTSPFGCSFWRIKFKHHNYLSFLFRSKTALVSLSHSTF